MQRIFGLILALSFAIMLPPIAIGLALAEATTVVFLDSFLLIGAVGSLLWWPVRNAAYELRLRDGFFVVAAIWVLASLVTSIPFMLGEPRMAFTQAVFESTSGLTTTGATTIVGLDALPKSVLFYR